MTEREAGRQLGGIVQIDDAYLGGERNGGKAGRGSENKVPFVIAVETSDEGHPRQVVITPLPGFTRVALAEWAQRHLRPETDVYSDGLGAFRPSSTRATRIPSSKARAAVPPPKPTTPAGSTSC